MILFKSPLQWSAAKRALQVNELTQAKHKLAKLGKFSNERSVNCHGHLSRTASKSSFRSVYGLVANSLDASHDVFFAQPWVLGMVGLFAVFAVNPDERRVIRSDRSDCQFRRCTGHLIPKVHASFVDVTVKGICMVVHYRENPAQAESIGARGQI